MILSMTEDDGKELFRLRIKRVDPSDASIALIKTVADLPELKKTRADSGKKREPRLALADRQPESPPPET